MSKLKIAVQKSGRLHDESMEILKDIGISIDNGKDQLKASARNFPLEVFYLRNGDIPQYLKDGVVDVAIIGENILIELSDAILMKLVTSCQTGSMFNSPSDSTGFALANQEIPSIMPPPESDDTFKNERLL